MHRMAPCHQALLWQNTYTELRKGSKKAVVVVWNNTTYPHTLWKKTPMARAVSVHYQCLDLPSPESLQVKDDMCPDLHIPKLMVRQRCGKLFDELDLSGLNLWAP